MVRLVLLVFIFVAAARSIPTPAALDGSMLGGVGATEALLEAFEGPDRAIVARGREGEPVGIIAPSLTFASFEGGTLALDDTERVAVLAFLGPDCPMCANEAQKLAVLSVVYFDEIYTVAVSSDGAAGEVASMIDEAGGVGLVLGGEDAGDEVASEIGVDERPALVVVGPSGTVDAVWTEDVPLNVLYAFLKHAYGFDGSGPKPLEPEGVPAEEGDG